MAKYMSTVFHTIVSKPIVIPKCMHTLLKFKYSSKAEECYNNDVNLREIDNVDEKQQRLLKVAIIGVPNSGKSSLINSIVQRNVRTIIQTMQNINAIVDSQV